MRGESTARVLALSRAMSEYTDRVRQLLGEALGGSIVRAMAPFQLYDIGVCDKCGAAYVVSKWPHRCQPKPGGPR